MELNKAFGNVLNISLICMIINFICKNGTGKRDRIRTINILSGWTLFLYNMWRTGDVWRRAILNPVCRWKPFIFFREYYSFRKQNKRWEFKFLFIWRRKYCVYAACVLAWCGADLIYENNSVYFYDKDATKLYLFASAIYQYNKFYGSIRSLLLNVTKWKSSLIRSFRLHYIFIILLLLHE